MVQRIVNSTVHEAIGVAPSQLLFGSMCDVDRGVYMPVPEDSRGTTSLSQWSDTMLTVQQALLDKARTFQEARNARHTRMSPSEIVTEYPVNSFVLVEYPGNALGLRKAPSKLHTNLKGPMRVLRVRGATYDVLDLTTNKESSVNVTRLRPYHHDANLQDPRQVAARDQQLFVVEKIVDMKGNKGKMDSLRFQVRWLGYEESDDTWESYSALKDNALLHEYLVAKGLGRLIPTKYRR